MKLAGPSCQAVEDFIQDRLRTGWGRRFPWLRNAGSLATAQVRNKRPIRHNEVASPVFLARREAEAIVAEIEETVSRSWYEVMMAAGRSEEGRVGKEWCSRVKA